MSQSVHNMKLTATDRTAGAFASIGARAGKLGGLMSAAFAGIGAYMGLAKVNDGIQYLGHLSDIAMKTGTSASELTSFSNALNMLGIQRVDIDSLGKAFDYMQKTTGRTGLSGMMATIEELSKIPDTAKRGQEAMRIFGRTGMEFMPLIAAAAKNGIGPLEGVIASMPRIADEASNSGDAVADAMDIASKGVESAWLGCIGVICGAFDEQFQGGVREAAAMAANWMEYYAKIGMMHVMRAWDYITTATGAAGTFFGALMSGEGSIGDRIKNAGDMYMSEIRQRDQYLASTGADADAKMAEYRKTYEARMRSIRDLQENSDKAAISGPGAEAEAAEKEAKAKVEKASRVSNALVMANSNAARKLSILGPTFQSESAKQTALQKRIAENQEKQMKADNADAAENAAIGTLEA